MMFRWSIVLVAVALQCAISAAPTRGAFSLQISEIWCGNEPGANLSEDWFEVTNVGDMAWSAAADGNLYFDDDSAAVADADLMSGIAAISPGESVVFVDGTGGNGVAPWSDLWDDVVQLPQVGSYAGAGLGQGGDAVSLFLDDLAAGVNLSLLDFESFPDANLSGGQSYDVVLGAFSTVGNASGAVATLVVNDAFQPAIGSPGPAIVPEPGSILLLVLGVVGLTLGRRR